MVKTKQSYYTLLLDTEEVFHWDGGTSLDTSLRRPALKPVTMTKLYI